MKTKILRIIKSIISTSFIAIYIFYNYSTPFILNSPIRAASTPEAIVNLPTEGFIGENFNFQVTFTNSGDETGYGPFIDLIFPFKGEDGVYPFDPGFENDGVEFLNATFIGTPVTTKTYQFTNENGGCIEHPYGVTNTGEKLQVCDDIGNILVVLQLPFGSFVPGQPNLDLNINAKINSWADEGIAQTIKTRAGFTYGKTALNDYSTDPTIVSSFTNNSITPRIMSITKSYIGPENETATGESFPREYQVQVNIADGQTVTNLELIDRLPNNIAYKNLNSTFPSSSTIISEPIPNLPQNSPDNILEVGWTDVTGGTGNNDANYRFSFFVPYQDANNQLVIPENGGCVNIVNDSAVEGFWTPIDPRDTLVNVSSDITNNDNTINACSHVIQKSVTLSNDTGPTGYTPGDILTYTINYQISDYFAHNNYIVTDTLSDGQRFYPITAPSFILSMYGNNYSSNFNPANYLLEDHFTSGLPEVSPIDGTQIIQFLLSQELNNQAINNGRVNGGCIPMSGGMIDCTSRTATTGQIIFNAIIEQSFTDDFLPQNSNVDQGDILRNIAQAEADVLDNNTFNPNGGTTVNGTSRQFSIVNGVLAEKSIYAINGIIDTYSTPKIGPGDQVTYKVKFILPVTDVEELVITDFLPLPVFDATTINSFNPIVDATVPVVGTSKFGPDDTFHAFTNINPAFSNDSAQNKIVWDFGSHQTVTEQSTVLDLLFTVEASDKPFADGLFLTNQAQSRQATTNNNATTATQITQVELTLPNLAITKGIVSSNHGNTTLLNPAPQVFSTPPDTGTCPRFTGIINSDGLANNPIDSDLEDVDAGDLITFAITVNNQGQGTNGAFDLRIKDNLPTDLVIPSTGLNLCVTNGAGTIIPFTQINPTDTNAIFENGIELTDPTPTTGVISKNHPTNGEDTIIITYNLELISDIDPNKSIENIATLMNYSASEGGDDFTTEDLTDSAIITSASPVINKEITSTSHTGTIPEDVVIGETATYTIEIDIPEGISRSASITETLGGGLSFDQILSITPTANISTDLTNGFNDSISNATISPNGMILNIPLGNITNSNNDNLVTEKITIVLTAKVLNETGIDRGRTISNNASFIWFNGETQSIADNSSDLILKEPTLVITQTMTPANVDAGDTVTINITVSHNGTSNSPAYDIQLSDLIPASLTVDTGTLSLISGIAPTTIIENPNDISATWSTLQLGESSTISFTATVSSLVSIGQTIVNAPNVSWTSLPGIVSGERTGNISDPGGAENDYIANTSNSISILTPSPTKTIAATSEAHTTNISSVERVAIGEIVRYRLVSRLAETTSNSFNFQDVLSTGLNFINDGSAKVAFVSDSNSITSSTLVPTSINCDGIGANPNLYHNGNDTNYLTIVPTCPLPDTAVSSLEASNNDTYSDGTDPYFKLGNVTNVDNDTNFEYVIIEFNALVRNITSNQTATQRNNIFNVRVNGTNVATSTNSNVNRVRIAEPNITISNIIQTSPIDSGDTFGYLITLTNNATGNDGADAFDVRLTDFVDSNLQEVTSITVTSPQAYTNNSISNNVDITFSRLNKGESAQILVQGDITQNASPNQQVNNLATVKYTSLPNTNGTTPNPTGSNNDGVTGSATGERNGNDGTGLLNDYITTATNNFTLNTGSISKLPANPSQISIGENALYDLLITFPEGEVLDLNVIDELPNGLKYIGYQIITSDPNLSEDFTGIISSQNVSGGTTDGEDVTINFANVLIQNDNNNNNNSFIIRLEVQSTNRDSNQQGTILLNGASMNFNDPNNAGADITINSSTSPSVTIIEPILTINKSAIYVPTTVEAGSFITYQIEISHDSSSNADAYNVSIEDLANVIFSSIENVNITTTGTISAPDFTINSGNLQIPSSGGFTLPNNGSTVKITYDAIIAAGASTSIANSAKVSWQSTSSANSETRTGQDGQYDFTDSNLNGINDYSSSHIDTSVTTSSPSIEKILIDTSEADTSELASPYPLIIGEEIRFALKIGMPEGNTAVVDISDLLAPNLKLINANIYTQATESSLISVDFNGSIDTNNCTGCIANSIGANLLWEMTDVNVIVDGNSANNYFVIEITAEVINGPINTGTNLTNQSTFQNTATVQANLGTLITSNSLNFEIVEPELTILKEFNKSNAHPNEELTVHINITNAGLINAYEVNLNDPINELNSAFELINSSESYTCSSGVTALGSFNITDPENVIFTISNLPSGESCDIYFSVKVLNSINPALTSIIENIAKVNYSSTNSIITTEVRNYPELTSTASINIDSIDLEISKDNGVIEMIENREYIYQINAKNLSDVAATGVIIEEVIPDYTTFMPENSTLGWNCPDINGGTICTFNLSDYISGDFTTSDGTITIEFGIKTDYEIDNSILQIENNVSIYDDGSHGLESNLVNNNFNEIDSLLPTIDLQITKTPSKLSVAYNDYLSYTLTARNIGSRTSTNVVITETIPNNSTFDFANSDTNWICNSTLSGGICTLAIGDLDPLDEVTAQFALITGNYPPAYPSIINTVSIDDDGNNGEDRDDSNNNYTATTPVEFTNVFDPPSASKTVTAEGLIEMEWKMVWINSGNMTAYFVRIIDPIPSGTNYLSNSFQCEARGASTTSLCTYDEINNQVIWEGTIAPDLGGTDESDSLNEVVLIFRTIALPNILTVENQAEAYWDNNNNGDVDDEISMGQISVKTNDPATIATDDPTQWRSSLADASNAPWINIIWGLILISLGTGLIAFTKKEYLLEKMNFVKSFVNSKFKIAINKRI